MSALRPYEENRHRERLTITREFLGGGDRSRTGD